jgi:hypothetical protein
MFWKDNEHQVAASRRSADDMVKPDRDAGAHVPNNQWRVRDDVR